MRALLDIPGGGERLRTGTHRLVMQIPARKRLRHVCERLRPVPIDRDGVGRPAGRSAPRAHTGCARHHRGTGDAQSLSDLGIGDTFGG
jgi:hypothetical protein